MTDTVSKEPPVKIDPANVLHSEPHKLIHLEDAFLQQWDKYFTGMQPTARRLLKWVADNI